MDKHGVGSYARRESEGGAGCSKTELLSVIERLKEKDMRGLVNIAALKHEIEALRSRLKCEQDPYEDFTPDTSPLFDTLLSQIEARLSFDYENNPYSTNKVITHALEVLPELKKHIREKYREALSVKKGFPWGRYSWIDSDKKIKKATTKTRFYDCMDYAWNYKNYERSKKLAEKLGIEPIRVRKLREDAELMDCWILVQFDFEHMAISVQQNQARQANNRPEDTAGFSEVRSVRRGREGGE